MSKKHFTIGMAGHIDHGKTELTKALTGTDTDRLKEEKQRKISIEPGYARLLTRDGKQEWSIVDVPGHEKFIRQMIAGVAGIDLVVFVVAADEGVMPQTVEHMEILSFLGMRHAVVALTKIDRVDSEMVDLAREDVRSALEGTPFQDAPIIALSSITGEGIEAFIQAIQSVLKKVESKNEKGSFRLPIDDVFTVPGQGTIVRGTIFEGEIRKHDSVMLLPQEKTVRVRALQVHRQPVGKASAGQRAALNLSGISHREVHRGNVLVLPGQALTTKRMDIAFSPVRSLSAPLKQRAPVKVHIGTACVMGKMIFFDRNRYDGEETLFCQLELVNPVVAKRGDRLIVRRATPVETIGGGEVIDPRAARKRFGRETVEQLRKKKEGSKADRILDVLQDSDGLKEDELFQRTGLDPIDVRQSLEHLIQGKDVVLITDQERYVTIQRLQEACETLLTKIREYHRQNPLEFGPDKARLLHESRFALWLGEAAITRLKKEKHIRQHGPYLALYSFVPRIPDGWRKEAEKLVVDLHKQKLQSENWGELAEKHGIPESSREAFRRYLLQNGTVYTTDDGRLLEARAFLAACSELYTATGGNAFSLHEAKTLFGLSRKYLIPFLELMDAEGLTVRAGNERKWVKRAVERKLR